VSIFRRSRTPSPSRRALNPQSRAGVRPGFLCVARGFRNLVSTAGPECQNLYTPENESQYKSIPHFASQVHRPAARTSYITIARFSKLKLPDRQSAPGHLLHGRCIRGLSEKKKPPLAAPIRKDCNRLRAAPRKNRSCRPLLQQITDANAASSVAGICPYRCWLARSSPFSKPCVLRKMAPSSPPTSTLPHVPIRLMASHAS